MEQFDEVFESDEGSRTEQRGVGESKPESVECRKDDDTNTITNAGRTNR